MSALTNLTAADTLFFDSIDFTVNGPSQISPGPRKRTSICVPKLPGQLRFKLNTKTDLAISKDVDFDVEFVGQPAGNNPNGDLIINWLVDQVIDRDFSVSGTKIHIDDVRGSILTSILVRNPRTQGQDCTGSARSIGIDLQTEPGTNKITVKGSASPSPGVNVGITVSADDVQIIANGRDQFAIRAKIKVDKDECGIVGSKPRFWVEIQNAPMGASVAYAWTVTGGKIVVGSTNSSAIRVQFTDSSTPIDLQVVVTIEGVSQMLTAKQFPETEQELRVKRLRCRILSLVRINSFVDPLWDPLRDYVAKPWTQAELRQMLRRGTTLIKDVNALLNVSLKTRRG